MEHENEGWSTLSYEEKNHLLFLRQKDLLDEFLRHGAISQAQHDKSLQDEPYEDCEETYARSSEWLLHGAFCLYSERELFDAYEKHHSTVKDACQQAEKLNVRNLLLYHTEDKNLAFRKRLYLEEGVQYYHGNLFIPDDLESLVL